MFSGPLLACARGRGKGVTGAVVAAANALVLAVPASAYPAMAAAGALATFAGAIGMLRGTIGRSHEGDEGVGEREEARRLRAASDPFTGGA